MFLSKLFKKHSYNIDLKTIKINWKVEAVKCLALGIATGSDEKRASSHGVRRAVTAVATDCVFRAKSTGRH